MASPTRAEVEIAWRNAVKLLEETRLFGNVNATNFVGRQDTFEQSLESDFVNEQTSAVARIRALLSGVIANSSAAAVILPHMKAYCRHVVNAPDIASAQAMVDAIYKYMNDNALTVNSQDFVFGAAVAGGGNLGNGTIRRLNVDAYGYNIEAQHADVKTVTCRFDLNTGSRKHEEIFQFEGQAPGPDSLQVSGSGGKLIVSALSARNSLLGNASFSQRSGTSAAPTEITSWTSSVTVNSTNYTFDEVNYYRDFHGDTTPKSLNMKVTANLTQKLSLLGRKLRVDVPYLLQVSWNRAVGAATGTLLARLGAQSNSVVAAAQTGWQQLFVPTAIGTNCWYRNFDEQDLDISLEWTRTGGELLIDDILLVPATGFDGSWYWIIGGSTPFLRDDVFTFTDTKTGAILNEWMRRGLGRYLPSATAAGETWTDP